MAIKPSLPKGTRDMLPADMLEREYILNIIRTAFRSFGFQAIETPAFEKVETLTGKYGQEGDRLIFKILPRGRKLESALAASEPTQALSKATEEALRYDLTVPLARYVVQNRSELNFPFKRFQIQPVWRADRPQRGRFREFYQCDADVVGSRSLLQELDFMCLYHQVFSQLQLPVNIKLNHRQVLAGVVEHYGLAQHFGAFTVALDKLDKLGLEGVQKELAGQNLGPAAQEALAQLAGLQGSNTDKLQSLTELVGTSELGNRGLVELRFLLEQGEALGLGEALELDITLARGLDYYTGAIFEVTAQDLQLGSLGGGGRYDDLTGIFGMKDLPGVGISFGLDRIQIALQEKGLLSALPASSTDLLMVNFGESEALFAMQLAQKLRALALKVEVFPEAAKLKKQLDYANKKDIPYALLIGESEMQAGIFTLKNMVKGTQQKLGQIELLEFFNQHQTQKHGLH